MSKSLYLMTDDLVLRDFTLDDCKAVHRYASDPEVCQFMPWGPNTYADTQAFVQQAISHAKCEPRYVFELAVCHKGTDVVIGGCGIRKESVYSGIAHVGFIINPIYQGCGYATQAVKALVQFGFARLGVHVIYATCDVENISSTRVLAKSGFMWVGRIDNHIQMKGRIRHSHRYEITSCKDVSLE